VLREAQERRERRRQELDHHRSPEPERRGRGMWRGRGQQDRARRPGFGELCRHLHKNLRRRMDDHEAYGLGGRFIELWKKERLPYGRLEEVYMVREGRLASRHLYNILFE
jgi:hypothetical protein